MVYWKKPFNILILRFKFPQENGIQNYKWNGIASKGDALLKQGKPLEAFSLFSQGIELLEKGVFNTFQSLDSRELTMENAFSVYEGAISCKVELSEIEEAFTYVQQAKSRSFIEVLTGPSLELGNVPQKLVNRRHDILASLSQLEKYDSQSLKAEVVQVQKHQDSLLEQLEIINAIIRDSSKAYAALSEQNYARLKSLQSQLAPNQAFIEFFWGQEIYAFIVTKNYGEVLKFENTKDIEEEILKLDSLVTNFINPYDKLKFQKFEKTEERHSQNLYYLLWEPIEDFLRDKAIDEIIIAPDNLLYSLSFELLRPYQKDKSDNWCLIDTYIFTYSQSATSFSARLNETRVYPKDFLIIGKSDFSHLLDSLPNLSPVNIQKFKTYFPNSDILLEEDASWDKINQIDLSKYKYIYISTHGNIHPTPELSNLVLHDGPFFFVSNL